MRTFFSHQLKIRSPRQQTGFTLIELMIVVSIVGILAAIVYPSYIDSLRKSRRTDGKDAMLRVQLEEEKYRANNPTYTSTLSDLNLTSATEAGYYTISLTAASTTGYTVRATAVAGGAQASDTACTPLQIAVTAAGEVKTPTVCWQ